jgi:hypothetical protein
MCPAIRHRGPDGAGFARLGDGAMLVGHVRLSIIDLATGAQPIFNVAGRHQARRLLQPSIVPRIRMLWTLLPRGSVLAKKIDILAGLVMARSSCTVALSNGGSTRIRRSRWTTAHRAGHSCCSVECQEPLTKR